MPPILMPYLGNDPILKLGVAELDRSPKGNTNQ